MQVKVDESAIYKIPTQIPIDADTDCTFINFHPPDLLVTTYNCQINTHPIYLIIIDPGYSVVSTKNSNIVLRICFYMGSEYASYISYQALSIEREPFSKVHRALTASIIEAPIYTLKLINKQLFDEQQNNHSNSIVITDVLIGKGLECVYVSKTASS